MSDKNEPELIFPDPERVTVPAIRLLPIDDQSIELVAAHIEEESLFCNFIAKLGTEITKSHKVNKEVRIHEMHIQLYNALPTRARGLTAALEGLIANFHLKRVQSIIHAELPVEYISLARHFLFLFANGLVLTTDNRRLHDHFLQRAAEDQNQYHANLWHPSSASRRLLPGGRWGRNTEAAEKNLELAKRFNDAEALRILGCGHLQYPPRNEVCLVSDEHDAVLETNEAIQRGVKRMEERLNRELTLEEHAQVTIDAARETCRLLRDKQRDHVDITRELEQRAMAIEKAGNDSEAAYLRVREAKEKEWDVGTSNNRKYYALNKRLLKVPKGGMGQVDVAQAPPGFGQQPYGLPETDTDPRAAALKEVAAALARLRL